MIGLNVRGACLLMLLMATAGTPARADQGAPTTADPPSLPRRLPPAAAARWPVPVPDGVIVRGGASLRTLKAAWVVLVTLEAPEYPEGLEELIQRIRLSQNDIRVYAYVQLSWRYRLDRLQRLDVSPAGREFSETSSQTSLKKRRRRGLINGVGHIFGYLFGTATQEQVDRYAEMTRQLQGRTEAIIHVTKSLTTVVDQTRTYMQNMTAAVWRLRDHARQVDLYVQRLNEKLRDVSQSMRNVEVRMEMDRAITDAERTYALYRDQVLHYHQQRSALERGMLTEDVMHPTVLGAIVEEAAQRGHETVSSLDWLYRFVKIEPIVIAGSKLIYKFELPIVSDHSYLLFEVRSIPVPIPNSNLSVRIKLDRQYGVSTKTGQIFMPSECMGVRPVICQAGPMYDSELKQCARGLIFNQSKLIHTCKFDLIKGSNFTQIRRLDINSYAITTWGEQLQYRCPGQIERTTELAAGGYRLYCQSPCSLGGKGWAVDCIPKMHIARHVEMPRLSVRGQFNFTALLKQEVLLDSFPKLQDLHAATIPNVDASLLERAAALGSGPWKTMKRHAPITSVLLTLLLLIALTGGAAYWAWRRYGRKLSPWCKLSPREKVVSGPREVLYTATVPSTSGAQYGAAPGVLFPEDLEEISGAAAV